MKEEKKESSGYVLSVLRTYGRKQDGEIPIPRFTSELDNIVGRNNLRIQRFKNLIKYGFD